MTDSPESLRFFKINQVIILDTVVKCIIRMGLVVRKENGTEESPGTNII